MPKKGKQPETTEATEPLRVPVYEEPPKPKKPEKPKPVEPIMSIEQYVAEFPTSNRGLARAFLIRSRTEQRKGNQFIQGGTRKELDAAFEKFIRMPVK